MRTGLFGWCSTARFTTTSNSAPTWSSGVTATRPRATRKRSSTYTRNMGRIVCIACRVCLRLPFGTPAAKGCFAPATAWALSPFTMRSWGIASPSLQKSRRSLNSLTSGRSSIGVLFPSFLPLVIYLRKEPIQTFSVGYAEDKYSELSYARQVAKHIGAEYNELILGPEEFFASLPQLIWHEDEPLVWPSSVALYYVSRLAGEKVKVVLTGECGDENLDGYLKYYLLHWKVCVGSIDR